MICSVLLPFSWYSRSKDCGGPLRWSFRGRLYIYLRKPLVIHHGRFRSYVHDKHNKSASEVLVSFTSSNIVCTSSISRQSKRHLPSWRKEEVSEIKIVTCMRDQRSLREEGGRGGRQCPRLSFMSLRGGGWGGVRDARK